MALIAFLRGVNVGGNRSFRPSVLARELSDYDVVSVGPRARLSFVSRDPRKLRSGLLRKLPLVTDIVAGASARL